MRARIGPGARSQSQSRSQLQSRSRSHTQMPSHAQSGQVLWLALLLLIIATVGLAFLLTAGQLIADKSRLRNAADSAALGAAVWRARVLNFVAYSNRAIIAQEVAVAQTLSLLSWARYFERLSDEVSRLEGLPASIATLGQPEVVRAAALARATAEQAASIDLWLRAAPESGYKSQLVATQAMMHRSAGVFGLGAVANEIVRAADARMFAFALPDQGQFDGLTRTYSSRDDRQRIADLVVRSLDAFVTGPRQVDVPLLLTDPCATGSTPVGAGASNQAHWFRKRGATALSADLNAWLSLDLGSIHRDDPARRLSADTELCADSERRALGWGAAGSLRSLRETGRNSPDQYFGNPAQAAAITDSLINPAARRQALDDMHAGYGAAQAEFDGIAAVRELAEAYLDSSQPVTAPVAVLARIDARRLDSTRLAQRLAGRLHLPFDLPGDRLWALSAATTYFRRPAQDGVSIEYASLFSPYWQARLTEPSDSQREIANGYAN